MNTSHPFIGRFCIIRTYSAGVHAGTVQAVSDDGRQVHLADGYRIWRWSGGRLSLSSIASHGLLGGRLDPTREVWVTEAIEILPVTDAARRTFGAFAEDPQLFTNPK